MAFFFAIRSAAITFTVTQSCSHGNLSGCSCDKTKPEGALTSEGWRWGGCSADIDHGLRFSRQFVDARETDRDARSLMNLHNNRAGRKAIADLTGRACRCSGVSGSCTVKICWTTLPNFRSVGDRLLDKYEHRTRQVQPIRGHRDLRPLFLTLKRSKKLNRKPRPSDLVFLDKSPNYCEFDASTASLGTFGRQCNRTSKGRDGCDYMCCGRGYTTQQFTRVWQCNCKFQWCCRVVCSECSEKTVVLACR